MRPAVEADPMQLNEVANPYVQLLLVAQYLNS
jgi:hypothetical protein